MESRQRSFFRNTSPNVYQIRRHILAVTSATDDNPFFFQCIVGTCALTFTLADSKRLFIETVLILQH